jgi:two-component system, NarL family, sensor kinase
MSERNGKKRKGSGVASVEPGARGAKRPPARKTPRRSGARRSSWAAHAGEGSSQATLEHRRAYSAERANDATVEALAQERARTAADIHDLVMQDLALALATARMLADDAAQATHASIVVAACERALEGARGTVDSLLAREARPVIDAVSEAACAASWLVPVSFHAASVPTGVQPDQRTLDVLVHVAREAVRNAVNHAAPSAVEVVLEYREQWRLLVCDDGRGFDVADADRGFGLDSMTAQARMLGGILRISSIAGTGTTIEAILP